MRRLLAAVLLLAGCDPGAGPKSDAGAIKIVSSLPRLGSAKAQTDTIVNGITMAIEEAGGKAGAFTIRYEDHDDATAAETKATAEREAAVAEQALKDPDVMVYIGPFNSGMAKISIPKLNAARLLMISPSNSWPGLTKPGKGEAGEPDKYYPNGVRNYCRVVPADDMQGPVGADWAKSMGVKKVYVLHDNEVYGKGIAELFKARADEIGLKTHGPEGIDVNAQEFRSLMTKVKVTEPDLVYFGGTSQTKGGQIAKDLVGVGLAAKLMVPDGCFEQSFIDAAGAANVNGRCYVTFGGLPPDRLTGRGKEFFDRYVKKHGRPPEAYAVYGYEAAKVALEAIRRAGKKDRDAIREACLGIRDFEGALGKWSFDRNGDTTLRTFSGQAVRGGKFEFVTLLGGD